MDKNHILDHISYEVKINKNKKAMQLQEQIRENQISVFGAARELGIIKHPGYYTVKKLIEKSSRSSKYRELYENTKIKNFQDGKFIILCN